MRDEVDDLEKNVNEKEQFDTKKVIERLADRVQKIEEKIDLLITLISPNNEIATAGKTGRSVKAETEINSSDDEEPSKKKAKLDAKTRSSDDHSEESDDEKETYPYSHGLYVGDRLAGGRCGGRGFCGLC
ncbi:hypothetical protein Bca4012_058702 [Brassica carinata]|uniref:Uncharacterized protein n=1 Tax=Brassica carinata TaxID=52824 RepID=A0A8X8B6C9_BRACI|nr:hypothetical protein Bca52824_016411 [Brassica carinata]